MYSRNAKLVTFSLGLTLVMAATFSSRRTRAQKLPDSNRAPTKTSPSRTIDEARTKQHGPGLRESLLVANRLSEDATQQPTDQQSNKPRGASNSSAKAQSQNADQNHTIVVHSNADNGPGSLREAITIASDGYKINIVAQGVITLTSGELIVDKNLTIRGPGKANLGISGNGNSRVFHIMPGTVVTLYGVTMTNGRARGAFPANAGGGVFNDHANLTVERCTISGNSARLGGGVFNNSKDGGSAKLTLIDSTVSDNTATSGYGGGIFSGGGFLSAGPAGDAMLRLDNTIVSSNQAGFGGGIFNDGFSGNATATIKNSAVNNNSVRFNGFVSGGGGIYNNGDSGFAILSLTNSSVNGNVAGTFVPDPTVEHPFEPGSGGGIYNDGTASVTPGNAQVTLDHSSVSSNIAQSEFPESRGGGVYNNGSFGSASVTASYTNINQNSAVEDGSGIYSICFSGEVVTTLTDSTVNGNVSAFGLGGIASFAFRSDSQPDAPSSAKLTLVNTVVRANSRDGIVSGGGDAGTGMLEVTNCEVSGNIGYGIVNNSSVTSPDSSAAISHSVISDNSGGGILNSCFSANISDSVISRNQTDDSAGGGIVNIANVNGSSNLRITSSTISDNSAPAGGGIANLGSSESFANLIVDRSTVSGNHAALGGGLLNDSQGSAIATITNSTLSGNSAEGDLPPDWSFSRYMGGGGVFNGYEGGGIATVNLINCSLSGNATQHRGGGIVNRGRPVDVNRGVARVTVNDCTLSGNSAAEGGDSIWNEMNIEDSLPPPPPPSPCPGCPPLPPPPSSKATVEFANTIFNVDAPGDNIQNISPGIITSRGYNLSSDAAGGDGSTSPGGFLNSVGDLRNTNPFLGPLQDNGGPTLTHALLFYSPAINAGDPNFNPFAFTPPSIFDQRGLSTFPRVVNGRIDIGAYEFKYP